MEAAGDLPPPITKPGGRGRSVADTNVASHIVQLLERTPNGLTDELLAKELVDVSVADRAVAINSLLTSGRIELHQVGSGMAYTLRKDQEHASKLMNLTAEDLLVYQHIQEKADAGIWSRDLRVRCNLTQSQVTKTIKNLESRKLIKSVKSVTVPMFRMIVKKNCKMYMLYELEPSREVTGGAWYNNQELDTDFIRALSLECLNFIKSHESATSEQVNEHVQSSGVYKVNLRAEDVQFVLDTLLYDGVVEEIATIGGVPCYKPCGFPIPPNHFTDIPCALCPVFRDCHKGGDISPEKCPYLTRWTQDLPDPIL